MNNNNNKQYNAIDIFKFICAILVCAIHIPVLPSTIYRASIINTYIRNCVTRIAVPFFFTTAGFFLFKKIKLDNIDNKVIKDYCFKILRLIGIWYIILIIGTNGQLWYLSALVVGIIFITILLKKKVKLPYIIIICLILFFLGLIGDSYHFIANSLRNNYIFHKIIIEYETMFTSARNGFFFGAPFILIGIIFATKEIKINYKLSYFLALISFILLIFEYYYLTNHFKLRDYNLYISLIPLVFFTFSMLKQIKLKDRPIYKKLRIYSILIYFSHNMFSEIIGNLINKYRIIDNIGEYKFFVVITLAIIFSIIIERLSQKQKYKFLKYLYS